MLKFSISLYLAPLAENKHFTLQPLTSNDLITGVWGYKCIGLGYHSNKVYIRLQSLYLQYYGSSNPGQEAELV